MNGPQVQLLVLPSPPPSCSSVRRVEAHFGTGIASLFLFEQSLIWLNVWLALLWGFFVNLPWGINPPREWYSMDASFKGFAGLKGMEYSW